MYRLIISPQAQKEIKKIKISHQSAIRIAVEDLQEYPLTGKLLGRELLGKMVYKVGVYRIIYQINQKDKVVNILSAGHRAKIYE